jgi:hypothetical protein
MKRMNKIPLAIATSAGVNNVANNESLVNLFAEAQSPNAKSTVTLLSTSGARLKQTIPNAIIGEGYHQGDLFVCSQTKLYLIKYNNFFDVGDVDFIGKDRVYFASNGVNLMITNGKSYSYSQVEGVKEITSKYYHASSFVDYQDGYFIFTREGTGEFFHSKLYSTDFIGTDYATSELKPDKLVRATSINQQLWLLSEESIEVYYNSGGLDQVFQRIGGSTNSLGCLNAETIQKVGTALFFVGNNGSVYQTQGYTPIKISNLAVEKELSETEYKEIRSTQYTELGHTFYVLHLKNITYVYDTATNLWHTRSSKSTNNKRWFIERVISKNFLNYGISGSSIYNILEADATDNGVAVRRTLILPPVNKGVDAITVNALQLDIVAGESLINRERFATLRVSKDGGKTYSSKVQASIGKVGEFTHSVIWRRLGRGVDFVFKIEIIADVQIKITGAFIR